MRGAAAAGDPIAKGKAGSVAPKIATAALRCHCAQMRTQSWRALAVAALLAVSASAEPAQPQATAEVTRLLTRLHANELLMLKGIRIRNRTTGKDVVIGRGGEAVLIEVEPGSYSLRRIDTAYFNLGAMRILEPELFFELQPGRVN